jgi:tape measure domain-containing protein
MANVKTIGVKIQAEGTKEAASAFNDVKKVVKEIATLLDKKFDGKSFSKVAKEAKVAKDSMSSLGKVTERSMASVITSVSTARKTVRAHAEAVRKAGVSDKAAYQASAKALNTYTATLKNTKSTAVDVASAKQKLVQVLQGEKQLLASVAKQQRDLAKAERASASAQVDQIKAISKARGEYQGLTDTIRSAGKNTKRHSKESRDALAKYLKTLRNVHSTKAQIAKASGKFTNSLKSETRGIRRATTATGGVTKAHNSWTIAMRKTAAGIAAVQGPLGPYAGRLNSVATVLSGALSPMGLFVIGAGATAVVLGKMASAAAKTAMEYESYHNTLKFASEGLVGFESNLSFVIATSRELGTSLAESIKGYAQLAAATKNTTLAGEETDNIFRALSESAVVLGMSNDDLKGSIKAVTQMISKGTISSEELRGQLGERLPGAMGIAARALGVTTTQLGEMLKRGEIIVEDFLPKFAKQMREDMAGSLEEASNATTRTLEKMRTEWDLLSVSIGRSVLEGINPAIQAAVDMMAIWNKGLELMRTKGISADSISPITGVMTPEDAKEYLDTLREWNSLQDDLQVISGGFLSMFVTDAETAAAYEKVDALMEKLKELKTISSDEAWFNEIADNEALLAEQAIVAAAALDKEFDAIVRQFEVMEKASDARAKIAASYDKEHQSISNSIQKLTLSAGAYSQLTSDQKGYNETQANSIELIEAELLALTGSIAAKELLVSSTTSLLDALFPLKAMEAEYLAQKALLIEASKEQGVSSFDLAEALSILATNYEEAKNSASGLGAAQSKMSSSTQSVLDALFPAKALVREYDEAMVNLKKDLEAGTVTTGEFIAVQASLAAQLGRDRAAIQAVSAATDQLSSSNERAANSFGSLSSASSSASRSSGGWVQRPGKWGGIGWTMVGSSGGGGGGGSQASSKQAIEKIESFEWIVKEGKATREYNKRLEELDGNLAGMITRLSNLTITSAITGDAISNMLNTSASAEAVAAFNSLNTVIGLGTSSIGEINASFGVLQTTLTGKTSLQAALSAASPAELIDLLSGMNGLDKAILAADPSGLSVLLSGDNSLREAIANATPAELITLLSGTDGLSEALVSATPAELTALLNGEGGLVDALGDGGTGAESLNTAMENLGKELAAEKLSSNSLKTAMNDLGIELGSVITKSGTVGTALATMLSTTDAESRQEAEATLYTAIEKRYELEMAGLEGLQKGIEGAFGNIADLQAGIATVIADIQGDVSGLIGAEATEALRNVVTDAIVDSTASLPSIDTTQLEITADRQAYFEAIKDEQQNIINWQADIATQESKIADIPGREAALKTQYDADYADYTRDLGKYEAFMEWAGSRRITSYLKRTYMGSHPTGVTDKPGEPSAPSAISTEPYYTEINRLLGLQQAESEKIKELADAYGIDISDEIDDFIEGSEEYLDSINSQIDALSLAKGAVEAYRDANKELADMMLGSAQNIGNTLASFDQYRQTDTATFEERFRQYYEQSQELNVLTGADFAKGAEALNDLATPLLELARETFATSFVDVGFSTSRDLTAPNGNTIPAGSVTGFRGDILDYLESTLTGVKTRLEEEAPTSAEEIANTHLNSINTRLGELNEDLKTADQLIVDAIDLSRVATVDMLKQIRNQLGWTPDGSHANGLDYVPYDGYQATLHKGEQVLTAAEVKQSSQSNVVDITPLLQEIQALRKDVQVSNKPVVSAVRRSSKETALVGARA